ncbi:hypothetical protein ALQ52_200065 [Pseudomonas cannabina pv. alisalensis]|nr:hypothetical protein ALQ52_200065 [Pseudomonas cannabina pv. alisalensis]
MRVEPVQQPVTNVMAIHAPGFDARVGQSSRQTLANVFQVHRRRLATNQSIAGAAPVDDHANPALLSAPGQLRHFGVFK